MEQQFYGSWGNRFNLLLFAFCGFGVFYFMVILAIQRSIEWGGAHSSTLVASIPFGIFGLLGGLFCLGGLAESFTVYAIDDDKIEKRAVYGTYAMPWRSIAAVKTRGVPNSQIVLTDDSGRRMRLFMSLLRDPRGELRAAINQRLAGLREKQMQELGWQERTYYPSRNASYLLLPLLLPLVGFAIWVLIEPQYARDTSSAKWGLLGLLGFLLFAGLGLWLYLFTWVVTISSGFIKSHSLFTNRTIPMSQIESVVTRDVPTKNGSINTTIIEGAGQKISFTANMPDYTLVRDYIEAQAGKQAVDRGKAAVPSIEKKERKQTMVIATLVSVIGLGGMSLFFIQTARGRLERQYQLDARGVQTVGRIDGKHMTGSKHTLYLIDYQFTANGRIYQHSSPVSYDNYSMTQPGSPVSIVYLPDDPNTARAQQSIARQEAESGLHLAYLLLALSFATPPLIYASLLWQSKKKAMTTG